MTEIMPVPRKLHITVLPAGSFTRESFDHWANALKSPNFQRVHKSYIVNFHYVTSYKYSSVTLVNNILIPIASHRQSDVRKAWFEYLRRR